MCISRGCRFSNQAALLGDVKMLLRLGPLGISPHRLQAALLGGVKIYSKSFYDLIRLVTFHTKTNWSAISAKRSEVAQSMIPSTATKKSRTPSRRDSKLDA